MLTNKKKQIITDAFVCEHIISYFLPVTMYSDK